MEIKCNLPSNRAELMRIHILIFASILLLFQSCLASGKPSDNHSGSKIIPAAERLDQYLPLLQNKRVGVFANHTSVVGLSHLVDTLQHSGIQIKKIFAPEHGFRGTADAGAKLENSTDPQTGIPVVSLYGKKLRPSAADLADIDIMLFDIQDVGARFYTYISSLEEYIRAAAENNKPLIILDRPNPNGFYVDGPVLDPSYKSFVGMQPVPVVYGMTIGEYAKMLIGEKWVPTGNWNRLTVIPCAQYDHNSLYTLPVKPSPNLPEMGSVYWYPSTCFFEGTVLSEGRGTEKPFQYIGHPDLPANLFTFTPRSREGSTNPKLKDRTCHGFDLSGEPAQILKKINRRIQISYLLEAYRLFPKKDSFFLANKFINKLAGSDQLPKQIAEGKTEEQIRASWEPGLDAFKKIRKKYLLYKDFE